MWSGAGALDHMTLGLLHTGSGDHLRGSSLSHRTTKLRIMGGRSVLVSVGAEYGSFQLPSGVFVEHGPPWGQETGWEILG